MLLPAAALDRGELERVSKRRYQSPKPVKEGRFYWLFTWQDVFVDGKRVRKRKRQKLAPASTPYREVAKIAAELLRPLNQGLENVGGATSFTSYVDTVYRPTVLPLLAKSTRDRYESVIKLHLTPVFGDASLRELTPLTIQKYFSGMTRSPLSDESRDKIRDVLSSILGSAVQYGLLVKYPVTGLKLPRAQHARRPKPYLTPEQFAQLIDRITEPYATMVYTAVFTGLRVSELIGLRWRCVHEDTITIDERYVRGEWGAPKSAASAATIPVNTSVIARLQRLKTLSVPIGNSNRTVPVVKKDGPDDLVFQSVRNGRPMRDNNILVRHLKPAARALGLDFVNWRTLRTSYATWLSQAGTSVRDAMGLLRHSRASTTLEIYQQFVPESQRQAVDRLSALLS